MAVAAIVGAQGRFPDGADRPDRLFDNLCAGRNYCRETPPSRWNVDKFINEADYPGVATVRAGHYLDYDHTQFDHQAFRMAPREVEVLDPQQRLLLEVTWEALENSGIPITRVAGRNVGVYVGGFTVDHLTHQFRYVNRADIGAHSAAGSTLTMLSNRLSYAFDLRGPSYSIDTACSSSLVAFAQAVQDIAAGRCGLAVVGGVNFMYRPEYMITLSKGRFLAADGRCKSFDAKADGYGRGEGCGVVILKDAATAEADGDDIICYVDGVGTNQDGRTSGITVPNADAQEELMRQVAAQTGIAPGTVRYVEAHGTGTAVGDPLEARSIGNVYGSDPDREPCVIGSVKSNIGHLEAGAGIAGIIKAAWVLRRNQIPPLATLESVNPDVPLDDKNIELARELQPLGADGGTHRVAVNSFGYGGTNAHLLLRSGSGRRSGVQIPAAPSQPLWLAPVSARSPGALAGNAARLQAALDADAQVRDVLYTAAWHRAHHEHRAAVWGQTAAELRAGLAAVAEGDAADNAVQGQTPREPAHGTVFVYTGMGPQWWGMGRGLWTRERTYRDTLREADTVFQEIAGFSILDEMLRDEADSQITRTEFAQPANLLVQIGLTQVLREQGIGPDAVVGHSVGELASAWASGTLSLRQALVVARHRSRVQAQAAGQGAMLALGVGEDTARKLCTLYSGRAEVAAVNAPASVTLSGEQAAIEAIAGRVSDEGGFARMLPVEVPYHSAFMEPLLDELVDVLQDVAPQVPTTALYSTVTGGQVADARYDADYWALNVRQPVRFMDAIRSLLGDGYRHFVEVGPHPVLRRPITDTLEAEGADGRLVPTLSMRDDDFDAIGRSIATFYVAGGPIDWSRRHPDGAAAALGSYAWDRDQLWRESDVLVEERTEFGSRAFAQTLAPHGRMLTDLNVRHLNFLDDHRIAGTPVLPAAAYLEALLEMGERIVSEVGQIALSDVEIGKPLLLDRSKLVMLDTHYDEGTQRATIESWESLSPSNSVTHVTASLRRLPDPVPRICNLTGMRTAMVEELPVEETYRRYTGLGLDYGPLFQPIQDLWLNVDSTRALAQLALAPDLQADAGKFIAHPVLLDGMLQAALALIGTDEGAYLPTGFGGLRLLRPLPERLWVLIDLTAQDGERIVCDFTLFDEQGVELASVSDFTAAPLTPRRPEGLLPGGDYVHDWDTATLEREPGAVSLIVVTDPRDEAAQALVQKCERAGVLHRALSWHDDGLIETLNAALSDVETTPRVVLVPATGAPAGDPVGAQALSALLPVLQDLGRHGDQGPRTYVVTRSGMPCDTRAADTDPAHAAIVNFIRTVYYELEQYDLIALDLDGRDPDLDGCLQELRAHTEQEATDQEVGLRNGHRLTPMLRRSGLFAEVPTRNVRPNADCPVGFADRALTELSSADPQDDEVRIAFEAVCLLPHTAGTGGRTDGREDSAAGPIMGFAGRVQDVGPDGDRALIGEAVFGAMAETLQTAANVRPDAVSMTRRPDRLTPGGAASIAPIQLRIASVVDSLPLARVDHAVVAATLDGLALADHLKAAGVQVSIIAGDSAEWTEASLPTPAGGFDLIAAPLPAWERHFGLSRWLAAGGHLVDLSWNAVEPVVLAANLGSLQRIATARDATALPAVADLHLAAERPVPDPQTRALVDWVEDGRRPAVIAIAPHPPVTVQRDLRPTFRSDGTYLVTGGFGGLGRSTALWLADNGAGCIAVAGRRGGDSPGADELLEEIRARGAEAVALALDTSDAAAVQHAVAELDGADRPLRGVVHTAGVLRDKPFLEIEAEDITHVLEPKAAGALALHEATKERDLDLFVMFSSISAVLGSKRQTNYCAANGFMDGLAHLRRKQGLPALSANIGAVSRVGMSAGASVEGHLRRMGLPPISPELALTGISVALAGDLPQVVVSAEIDWERLVRYEPTVAQTDRLLELCGPYLNQNDAESVAALKRQLQSQQPAERIETLGAVLRDIIASELRLASEMLAAGRPLDEVGVDSLMALNIQTAIERATGVTLSTLSLTGEATIESIAERMLSELGMAGDGVEGEPDGETTATQQQVAAQ